jgi:Kdo2-lipid IVA lauroyltransferase/acyltransferase
LFSEKHKFVHLPKDQKLSAIGFYIALPFIYFASVLPFPLLYLLSDFHFFLIYYVVGYRKKVVLQNLRNSFPGKPEEEIKQISKKYFRYLCDLTFETFKTLSISPSQMLKHCEFSQQTVALFKMYYEREQSVIITMGHFGNWEWAGNSFGLTCKQQLYVIYHPLSNPHFNKLIIKMRTRFGTKLIPMRETMREMLKNRDHVNATAFIADQTPPVEGAHWTTFMNQETPVFKGTEKIAKKLNCPVLYTTVKKVRRGYYLVHTEILHEQPANTADGEISELHTKKLEKDIIESPETWLWSHRRWKHKRPLN